MRQLPDALAAMGQYQQFIVYTTEQLPNGRSNKYPVNPHTMEKADAHNPAIWVSAQQACDIASAMGMGVGFVFTENDPFFFVDIDDCKTIEGQWNHSAQTVCSWFAGCAMEISVSGRGLHIFGVGSVTEERRKKNKELNFDIYTSKRFVALTGTGITGNAAQNAQNALTWVVDNYLQRDVNMSEGWTEAPCEGWAGHVDDQELLAQALRSQSVASVLGGGVTFKDLWEANPEKLGEKYPHDQGTEPFDHSAADAALCQHLAFWTGRDCARIDRLFRMSALMRPKWDQRPDYIQSTVMGACGNCTNVHDTVKQVEPTEAVETIMAPYENRGEGFEIQSRGGAYQIMTPDQQPDHFKGCVYVADDHVIFTPAGTLLKPDRFKVMYGGYVFSLDAANNKTCKNAFEVFTESQAWSFPKADATCFRPELDAGSCVKENDKVLVNVYKPIEVNSVQGDVTPFINHLNKLLPNPVDAEILLSFMAACVQYKGVKFQWSPMLQGVEGNGKTLFARCIMEAIGHQYCHIPKASELAGSGSTFNGWIENKLFLCIEEIHQGNKRDLADGMKEMVTNDRIEAQSKGSNQKMIDNRANILMLSNHKDGVIKQKNDRRYACLFSAQQSIEDMIRDGFMLNEYEPTSYISDLYDWLKKGGYANVTHYLQNYKINEKYNPATRCHRAPATSSLDEAIVSSYGMAEQEILESIYAEKIGFRGGYISSIAVANLLKDMRLDNKIPQNKRKQMMATIGYEPHPHLQGGRLSASTNLDDGKRPVIYVKKGSLQAQITDAKTVYSNYVGENELGSTFNQSSPATM